MIKRTEDDNFLLQGNLEKSTDVGGEIKAAQLMSIYFGVIKTIIAKVADKISSKFRLKKSKAKPFYPSIYPSTKSKQKR